MIDKCDECKKPATILACSDFACTALCTGCVEEYTRKHSEPGNKEGTTPQVLLDTVKNEVKLTSASISTSYMHAFAHSTLESTFAFVKSGQADAAYLAHCKNNFDLLKITSSQSALSRSQHERHARGFDSYISKENRSPGNQRTSFELFKDTKLKGPREKLSEGARSFFDSQFPSDKDMARLLGKEVPASANAGKAYTARQIGALLSVWAEQLSNADACKILARDTGYNDSPWFFAGERKAKLQAELAMVNTALAIFAVNQVFDPGTSKEAVDAFLSCMRESTFDTLERKDATFKKRYAARMGEYFKLLSGDKPALGMSFALIGNLELNPLKSLDVQMLVSKRLGNTLSQALDLLKALKLKTSDA